MTGLITMADLTNEDIVEVLDAAERLLPAARGEASMPLLSGRILGNPFFEPSTRTWMSSETAMKRLGATWSTLVTSAPRRWSRVRPCSIRFRATATPTSSP